MSGLIKIEIQGELESVENRHRRERKELQAKIQSMKKNASKDKKKKKEILEEIVRLEFDLNKKHLEESTNNLNLIDSSNKTEEEEISTEIPSAAGNQRISKAQKRREKKEAEEKVRQIEILAQEELNKNGPRFLEMHSIKKILQSRSLVIYPIPSDGDCLFNAVRHQMEITGRICYDVEKLRNMTSDYILNNKDTLIFYMTNPETNDSLTDEEFLNYCEAVRSTKAWGGQIELTALSNVLKVPIEVLQGTGPATIQGDDFQGPNLVLTYHRHMYSLGEHYNSTKIYVEADESDGDENNEKIE